MKYHTIFNNVYLFTALLPLASMASPAQHRGLLKRQGGEDSGTTMEGGLNIVEVDPNTGLPMTGGQEPSFSPANSQKLKRAEGYSRAINLCRFTPPNQDITQYQGSFCRRSVSPQAYTILCNDPNDPLPIPRYHQDNCHDNEICVDGVNSVDYGPGPRNAYCVSTENFYKLAAAKYGGQSKSVTLTPSSLDDLSRMNEVVLTGASGITQPFNASHLKLEARDSNKKTIKDPQATSQCDDCSSIGIQPWPKGTKDFFATVTYMGAGDDATIYGALVSPNT